MLDFVTFIGDSWTADSATKTAFLEDFCSQYGYQATTVAEDGTETPNPVTRAEFANEKIQNFIVETVNAYRSNEAKRLAEFAELVME